ncbi:hypothetical protein L596_001424 [Steinernema carpocapsae]|uniref:Uncharacterized protein n=1 Tax=Steinernema carpocapsae TaxID=34508 RepID=A0A4U8UL73_STECR|nr:hypothetical protein L596_001424 [Steinernema carpocapsae]
MSTHCRKPNQATRDKLFQHLTDFGALERMPERPRNRRLSGLLERSIKTDPAAASLSPQNTRVAWRATIISYGLPNMRWRLQQVRDTESKDNLSFCYDSVRALLYLAVLTIRFFCVNKVASFG